MICRTQVDKNWYIGWKVASKQKATTRQKHIKCGNRLYSFEGIGDHNQFSPFVANKTGFKPAKKNTFFLKNCLPLFYNEGGGGVEGKRGGVGWPEKGRDKSSSCLPIQI